MPILFPSLLSISRIAQTVSNAFRPFPFLQRSEKLTRNHTRNGKAHHHVSRIIIIILSMYAHRQLLRTHQLQLFEVNFQSSIYSSVMVMGGLYLIWLIFGQGQEVYWHRLDVTYLLTFCLFHSNEPESHTEGGKTNLFRTFSHTLGLRDIHSFKLFVCLFAFIIQLKLTVFIYLFSVFTYTSFVFISICFVKVYSFVFYFNLAFLFRHYFVLFGCCLLSQLLQQF